jgi:hypothetical protein
MRSLTPWAEAGPDKAKISPAAKKRAKAKKAAEAEGPHKRPEKPGPAWARLKTPIKIPKGQWPESELLKMSF